MTNSRETKGKAPATIGFWLVFPSRWGWGRRARPREREAPPRLSRDRPRARELVTGTSPFAEGPVVQSNMAATMKKAAAEDVNVTFEDQQKINKFARNTSRITELKEEIEVKKKQLQNLEDACDDMMMLDDEDSILIPYQIGDVFISHSQDETHEMLEEAKKNLQGEIEALESRVESIQRVLSDLKVQLYAKFGNNINLEADDS
uniref:Prefoldin subunit 4 n=5 Tax=Testudinoidea TaxID=8486 RepID=A0A8C3HNA0_CHRPI